MDDVFGGGVRGLGLRLRSGIAGGVIGGCVGWNYVGGGESVSEWGCGIYGAENGWGLGSYSN